MSLQRVLCYSYTYGMTFTTYFFKMKHVYSLRVRFPLGSWQILGAQVPGSDSSNLFYPLNIEMGLKNHGIFYVKKLIREN